MIAKYLDISFIKTKLLALMLTLQLVCTGQISPPDAAFLEYLRNQHGYTLDFDNRIIPSGALRVTEIYCFDSNVSSLEGVQCFKNLEVLGCYRSKLRYLPSLDSLKKLRKLIVYENELDSLPSLSGLPKLTSIVCYSNRIKKLPSLHNNPLLDTLVLGLNLFEDISEVSQLNNLIVLGAWNCKLKEVPPLRSIHLKSLSFGTNLLLNALPDLSQLKDLEYLDFDNNSFSSMPDLRANINLKQSRFFNNILTFEDIIPLLSHPNFSKFEFFPQAFIGKSQFTAVYEGSTFSYDLNIDKAVPSNTYRIYKDNVLIDSNTTGTLNFAAVTTSQSGSYHFEVVNAHPLLKPLVLKSQPFTLHIVPKIDVSALTYTSQGIRCNNPGSLQINIHSIRNGLAPYSFKLIGSLSKDTLSSTNGTFTGLMEENYDLLIVDGYGIKTYLSDKIKIPTSYDGCDPIVLTPNGDGLGEELYIAQPGPIKIFDKQGNLIRELNGPTLWNVADASGQIVTSGYYFIKTREDHFKVAVVW